MSTRILFVCLGNICRSPTAEGILRARAPHLVIDSAGTSNWHLGEPPYGPMQRAAAARGYDLSSLRARQFCSGDFTGFDLILGMDGQNVARIEGMRPTGNGTAVRLLTDFAPEAGHDHVPDPYYTRDFDGTIDLIERAVDGLLARL